jgi:transcription-repair coupling factor (superfamily II helicase)
LREAVLREILRGGQVYFLHNSVESIEYTAEEIQKLIPEARVHVAHGQMRERELERIMSDFYHQRFNVLVCTTIIETGIDIPTANTIIIDRADKFGLAQLHQLRGRVGRSHHQAYAYLMTEPERKPTKDAQKRLEAIAAFDDLGLGFTLATHDLEIRGAGELLGDNQSGNIQAIGFTLYMEMLEKAVESIKSGKIFSLDSHQHDHADVDLKISALIPSAYVADVHERLTLYKRIASVKDLIELNEIRVEMIDRFGLFPAAVNNLFGITEIKIEAKKIGIRKIEANPLGGRIEFHQKNQVEPTTIINLIQKQYQRYQLDGPNRLKFKIASDSAEQRIQRVKEVMLQLLA